MRATIGAVKPFQQCDEAVLALRAVLAYCKRGLLKMVSAYAPSSTQEQRGYCPVYCHARDRNHAGRIRGPQATLLRGKDHTASPGPDGLIRIWLDRDVVDRLDQMRGPGESYSDVVLRLARA